MDFDYVNEYTKKFRLSVERDAFAEGVKMGFQWASNRYLEYLSEFEKRRTNNIIVIKNNEANDWISVNDRLPEAGEYVFIVIEMKYEHEKEIETVVDIGWLNEDGDFGMINDWYEGQQHFKITHWQEIVLPKRKE